MLKHGVQPPAEKGFRNHTAFPSAGRECSRPAEPRPQPLGQQNPETFQAVRVPTSVPSGKRSTFWGPGGAGPSRDPLSMRRGEARTPGQRVLGSGTDGIQGTAAGPVRSLQRARFFGSLEPSHTGLLCDLQAFYIGIMNRGPSIPGSRRSRHGT
jgi:hypothetical protein